MLTRIIAAILTCGLLSAAFADDAPAKERDLLRRIAVLEDELAEAQKQRAIAEKAREEAKRQAEEARVAAAQEQAEVAKRAAGKALDRAQSEDPESKPKRAGRGGKDTRRSSGGRGHGAGIRQTGDR